MNSISLVGNLGLKSVTTVRESIVKLEHISNTNDDVAEPNAIKCL